MFDIGRICIKTAGREAGKHCVIVKRLEENFVLITGPKIITKVRRRRCNIDHLEPLQIKVNIKEDASDEEVLKAYEKENIFEKIGIEKISPEKLKLAEEKKKQKEAERLKKEQAKVEKPKEEKKPKPEPKKEKAEKPKEVKKKAEKPKAVKKTKTKKTTKK
jgi:large subunit ribosomal protein L14e